MRRGHRRQTMLLADAVRAVAVLSLPIAYFAGHLTLTHLYVVAFIVGTFDVTFAVAYQALLVAMVNRKDYLAANSLLNGTRSLAEVVGLALGGTLDGLLTAPVALQLNAVSFAVSGSQLARIHPSSPHLTPPAHAASAGPTGPAAVVEDRAGRTSAHQVSPPGRRRPAR